MCKRKNACRSVQPTGNKCGVQRLRRGCRVAHEEGQRSSLAGISSSIAPPPGLAAGFKSIVMIELGDELAERAVRS